MSNTKASLHYILNPEEPAAFVLRGNDGDVDGAGPGLEVLARENTRLFGAMATTRGTSYLQYNADQQVPEEVVATTGLPYRYSLQDLAVVATRLADTYTRRGPYQRAHRPGEHSTPASYRGTKPKAKAVIRANPELYRCPVSMDLPWHEWEIDFIAHPEKDPGPCYVQKMAAPAGVRIMGWARTFNFGRLYLGFRTNRGLCTWLDKIVAEDVQHFISDVLLSTPGGYARIERVSSTFDILRKCLDSDDSAFRDQIRRCVTSRRVVFTIDEIRTGGAAPTADQWQGYWRVVTPQKIWLELCVLALLYKIMERSPRRFVERQGCDTEVVMGHSLEDWFRAWTAYTLFRHRRRSSQIHQIVSINGPGRDEAPETFKYRTQSEPNNRAINE